MNRTNVHFDFIHQNPPLVTLYDPATIKIIIVWAPTSMIDSSEISKKKHQEKMAFENALRAIYPEAKINNHALYGELTTTRWKKIEKDYRKYVKEHDWIVIQGHLKNVTYTSPLIFGHKNDMLNLHHVNKEQLTHVLDDPIKKQWVLDILVEGVKTNWDKEDLIGTHFQPKRNLQWQNHWYELLKSEIEILKIQKKILKSLNLPPPKTWNDIERYQKTLSLDCNFDFQLT